MTVQLSNNARSVLASAVSATTLTLVLRAGDGAKFPALTGDDDEWFPVALEDASGRIEYCRATLRVGDTITVLRGQEDTKARAYPAGAACELRLTQAALLDIMGNGGGGSGGGLLITVSNGVVVYES